ncbi:HAMP domain-containing sensor histidine kinase [uncultured Clostridium sp.]|uniref:sensor histidine kinase n=1 Tax=uncultured Clostridium sp. TaxID=59620 RepID=UPI0028E4EC2E|nr:HAMP domain-containing sensor histidine kinase [uncultured Clostridium sp.]
MTIKKRLFISNLLMLVIPAILSLIMVGGTILGVMEIMGEHDPNEKFFYESMDKINKITNKWSENMNLDQMKTDIDKFNEKNKDNNISLSIYEGQELLYPSSTLEDTSILNTALSKDGNHMFIMDNIAVYKERVDKYNIVIEDTDFTHHNKEDDKAYDRMIFTLGVVMFFVVIAIILLTNRFLTRFVFKRIITPLETLVYGVHQIRDGNLDFHIDYNEKDEFEEICSDFNEMAQRLLDSVKARQKDEANRKELIAGISHDLRTPLTSIKAYVEGLETGVASTPETQKRYLDTIKNKTSDLEHIVSQLFLFSKLDVGEFPLYLEKVDIGKELSNITVNLSEEYKEKGLVIKMMQNVKDICIQADIVQLRNAVINVLENSVKYKNKEQGQMKISCEDKDNYVVIRLEDNGPGVSSEALEKLFDVFYRTDPSRSNPSKGSGLGLSITAKILEQLGGSVKAENVAEGGLAIIMILPKYTGNKNN